MDLHTQRPAAKDHYRSGSSHIQCSQAGRNAVDASLHREIEALIPGLTGYAKVLTRDAVAADDLVQDCLARALGKIGLWQQGTDLRAWLFTILHNRHISLARRNMRQRAGIESQKSNQDLMLAPTQAVRLELRDLERALARLPEGQRSVILLVGLDGMGYEEAASVVNLPVGTVRSRVSRGRESLRSMTGLFPLRHSREARAQMAPSGNHVAPFLKDRKSASSVESSHREEADQASSRFARSYSNNDLRRES
jgi:RNA polymerase sigma factor (sigma-70 family)